MPLADGARTGRPRQIRMTIELKTENDAFWAQRYLMKPFGLSFLTQTTSPQLQQS
jgi:hypothetical protein